MHIPPNWGTFFALIVSFLVFWFIFSRIFFRPFLDLMSKREQRFKDLGERTELLIRQAQAADEEREKRILAIRREEAASREAQRRQAEAEASKVLEAAKADARATLERANAHIEAELKNAERQLDEMGRSLATELAQRVLGRPLNGAGRASN
jgi:F0F1-type ATP synthase membrane subunit b/b'